VYRRVLGIVGGSVEYRRVLGSGGGVFEYREALGIVGNVKYHPVLMALRCYEWFSFEVSSCVACTCEY
jgi:hypothetical protein